MYSKAERIVQLRKSGEEDDSPVTGIHLKVKQNLQVIQYSCADIVRFVHNDNRGLPFFYRKPVDFVLYDFEVLRFPVGRHCTKFCSKVTVEIHNSQRRKAGVDYLVKGRIQ